MKKRYSERVRIGTSGWSYGHWKGRFYPEDLTAGGWLAWYAERFRSVEINNSFYRLPEKGTLESWAAAVPADFIFTAKASRYITHMKKLREPGRTMKPFLRRMSVLEEKLGPILFQLPPHWSYDGGRLARFLKSLGDDFRYAFEFRDRSWINDEATDLLSRHGAAFCIYDFDGFLSPRITTADFVYVRLHGPSGAYRGSYDRRTLAGWAGAFSTWSAMGLDVWCYFDNDERAHAAENAERLDAMMRD